MAALGADDGRVYAGLGGAATVTVTNSGHSISAQASVLNFAPTALASLRIPGFANSVAVVSDGSAILGLGNLGPEAAMPVMEGKIMLLKEFADIDCWPICLSTQDPDRIVECTLRRNAGDANACDLLRGNLDQRCRK